MPVVDEDNRILGIVSQADVARCADRQPRRFDRRAVSDTVSAISEPTQSAYR